LRSEREGAVEERKGEEGKEMEIIDKKLKEHRSNIDRLIPPKIFLVTSEVIWKYLVYFLIGFKRVEHFFIYFLLFF